MCALVHMSIAQWYCTCRALIMSVHSGAHFGAHVPKSGAFLPSLDLPNSYF